MMSLIRASFGAALLAIAAASPPQPAAFANESEQVLAGGDRQILVMLNLPPPHYKPGRSYAGSYGDVQSAVARRRLVRRIARENNLELEESWPMPLLGVDCFVMRVPPGRSIDDAVADVSRYAAVAWSQPMQPFEAQADTSNADPLFRASPTATSWRLASLHQMSTGRGARIAVIDSKVEVTHPDLAGQFAASRDFVRPIARSPEQHGTAVAGIIAAKAHNGVGTVGVAPNARLMALRACWQAPDKRTLCNSLSLARALQFAIQSGASVINLSLSGPNDILLQKLIALALARGISVVAAFNPRQSGGGFPASQPGVIAVADESLQPLPARLYRAPGKNVPTTYPGGKWNMVSGSSYSAAHVSGLVALVQERRCRPAAHVVLARSNDGTIDACATLLRTRGCSQQQSRPLKCG